MALAGPCALLHTEDTDWGSGEDDHTEAPNLAFVQDPDVLGGGWTCQTAGR